MLSSRPQPLSLHLALASLVSVLALGVVCGVGIVSMRQLSLINSTAMHGEIELFDNATALQELLYQKGFVAYYLLTGDRDWLVQLDHSRESFARWLEHAQTGDGPVEARQSLLRLAREYGAFDEARRHAIATLDAGRRGEAIALIKSSYFHHQRLLALCHEFSQLGHNYAQGELTIAQISLRRRTQLLLMASIAGILASLAMGFLLARRIAKPIYELQLQVASAVQKTRLQVVPGRAGLEALGEHMAALLRKLEETDAAILEQRQRLIQSEKMSAIGEVTAKLTHELLNPLAGMKAAVQLLFRSASGQTVPAIAVRETANALDQEATRIDQLVRRLINYSKPLAPRLETCTVTHLFDTAIESVRLAAARTQIELLRQESPNLPSLQVDPLLLTQALVNLLANAVQATPPKGHVTLLAQRLMHLAQDYVSIQILDEGPGISAEHQAKLFHPFFTTKAQGHGLGLAITRNIIMEHGGQVSAHNRTPGSGAVFEVLLPLTR